MTEPGGFFRKSDSELGVFYPRHCIAAVFLKEQPARNAADQLRDFGFTENNVLAASGKEVIEFDKQHKGLARLFMQALSRFFKTEQYYADHDLELAREGAGFVIVRCADTAEKESAWSILKRTDPWDARYYDAGAVEHLAGDPDTD